MQNHQPAADVSHGTPAEGRSDMRSAGSRWRRLVTVLVPAAAVTVGLFAVMDRVIRADEVALEEAVEIRTSSPRKPQPVEVASAPPPPPALSSTVTDVNVPAAAFVVSTVPEVRADISRVALPPSPVIGRTLQPIRPPAPVFPERALVQNLSGTCEVRFDVSPQGKPFNVAATCSDPVFVSSAERAMRNVEFAPEIRDGQRVERRNVVYPLTYSIE